MNRKRNFIFLFLLLMVSQVADAQELLGGQSSVYISGVNSWASGKYKTSLRSSGANITDFGILFGYLKKVKPEVDFPLMIGGEIGYQNQGAGTVDAQIGGDFRSSNSCFWLNGVARYRPVFWSARINPYLDVSAGPKVVSAGIYEQFNAEEYTRLDGKTSVVFNTTVGIGLGVKIPTPQARSVYFDMGLYYQQTSPTKIVERNSVYIDSNSQIGYRQQITPINNTQLRFGLTWFL